MSDATPLSEAISMVGLVALARGLNLTHQALRKWERAGRMPRTEWTGETAYADKIEAMTGGRVTKTRLLAPWPVAAPTLSRPAQPSVEHAVALQLIERRAADRRQDGGPPPDGYYKRTGGQRRREWR